MYQILAIFVQISDTGWISHNTFRFPKYPVTFLSVAFASIPPVPAPLLILPCASSASSNKLLSFPSDCQSKQLAPSADLQKTTNVDVYLSPENTALVCVCVDVLPPLLQLRCAIRIVLLGSTPYAKY